MICFLTIVALTSCAGSNVVGHKDLAPDENIFIGRVFYLEDRALAKNKTFLQSIGVDEWYIKDITLCFSDGNTEKICSEFSEYSIRLEKHKDNRSALLTFKSKAKTIRFTDVHLSAAGSTDFTYAFINPPQITVSGKGGSYYLGDLVIYLKGDADKDKIPRLSITAVNKTQEAGKIFSQATRLDHDVRVTAKPFNLKGAKYKATRTDVVRHTIPVIYFKPR